MAVADNRIYRAGALTAAALILLIFDTSPTRAQAVAAGDATVTLSGHVPNDEQYATCLGRMPSDQKIDFVITLPMRNRDLADTLIRRLYDPGDPMYGQYLSTSTIESLFSPTAADYDAVIAFAQSRGLVVTGTHDDRLLVDVEAGSAMVESALGVHLNRYQQSTGRVYYAPDGDPSVPAALDGRILGFVGLDSFAQPTHNNHVVPAGGPVANDYTPGTIGTGVGNTLSPSDIRKAYGFDSSITETGSGQTLALFELDGYSPSDIAGYESHYGLGSATVTPVRVDGSDDTSDEYGEVTLDIEMMLAMAPGIGHIRVYEGPSTAQGTLDTWTAIYDDAAMVKVASTSWGYYEYCNPPSFFQTEGATFQLMALAGQTVYAAAGDSGAYGDPYDAPTTLVVQDPSSQPYVTGVGGTTLAVASLGGAYASETTWNDPADTSHGGPGGGGGGSSAVWSIPSYQERLQSPAPDPQGRTYSLTARNIPDVSLNASGQSAYSIYLWGAWYDSWGTSAAAPLWAGFTALVNERRAAKGAGPIGFINPDIYTIGLSDQYHANFHDIADGSTNNYWTAVTGFDDATGWGSFKASALIATLADTPAPSAPANLAATAGSSQVTLHWTASAGAIVYRVYRSATPSSEANTAFAGGITSTSYTDSRVTNGATYYYKVTAVNTSGASAFSNEAHAVLAPQPPASLTATVGVTGTTLHWTASAGAIVYRVYRSTASGEEANPALVGGLTVTSYTDARGISGVKYYYEVTAVDTGGASGFSNEVGVEDAPSAPLSLTATAGVSHMTLHWTASAGTIVYRVYRSTTSGGETNPALAGGLTSTNYTDTAVSNGVTYYYKVTAVNTSGASPFSTEVHASAD